MGGGGKYPYPKYVYSPLGGWWYEGRPNAHKNVGFKLVVLGGVLLAGGIAIFNFSANYERRSVPTRPIPSQRWCKHTEVDDPNYYFKFVEYKKNKPSILSRVWPEPDHH